MNDYNKKYNPVPIPKPGRERLSRNPGPASDSGIPNQNMPPAGAPPHFSQNSKPQPLNKSGMSSEDFYEIEYDSGPFPGVGRFVLKSQKIEPPPRDEIRELFQQMRDIAREERFLNYHGSKFYDKKVQQENARIFYRQGLFMKDFEDHYENMVPFSSYFPNYQMMGYEQLRTYFTWRTKLRQGEITEASLSYAFLYLYELLNNIGVENPADGLAKLVSFWDMARTYHKEVDKYVLKWIKDYHIYYELPWSFKDFIVEKGLGAHYPNILNPDDNFDLLCSISKYDVRKSGFYNDDTVGLIRDCFDFVIHRLREAFTEHSMSLDNFLFQPPKNMTPWTPFRDALFYSETQRPDRQVVLSEKEIYICRENKWMFHSIITTESGKQLIGYVLKQMEAALRKAVKYKYKLSANLNSLGPATTDTLRQAGISLETLVEEAVKDFYRETTKTVVSVDPGALDRIRQEALLTQEKLIVPEEEAALGGADLVSAIMYHSNTTTPSIGSPELTAASSGRPAAGLENETAAAVSGQESASYMKTMPDGQLTLNPEMLSAWLCETPASETDIVKTESGSNTSTIMAEPRSAAPESAAPDPWQNLLNALNDTEKQALFILWREQAGNAASFLEAPPFPADGSRAAAVSQPSNSQSAMEMTDLLTDSIKQFAQKRNIMLEVLIDGINDKAMDQIGDSLLDGEFAFYEDYTDQIEGMVKHIWQDKSPQESPIS